MFLFCFASSAGSCELQGCWDLYQSAQVALGLRDEFASRDHTPSPVELRHRCLALRTFLQCIRNMTRCKGDLSFHSAHRGIERQMKQFNCSMTGPVFPANHAVSDSNSGNPTTVCSYRGRAVHKHCGLFGDPHLRTFEDDFQTCKVQGAWPLLDNDYLTVQVTNDPVGLWEGTATATSKVRINHQSDTLPFLMLCWGLRIAGPPTPFHYIFHLYLQQHMNIQVL